MIRKLIPAFLALGGLGIGGGAGLFLRPAAQEQITSETGEAATEPAADSAAPHVAER